MENEVNLSQIPGLAKAAMVMKATTVPQVNNSVPTNESANYTAPSNDMGMQEKPLPGMNDMLAQRGIDVNVPEYNDDFLYEEAVDKSKLPPHIKKLMSEQRIQPPSTVQQTANVPEGAKRLMQQETKTKPQQMVENHQPMTSTQTTGFSREEMKGMIKEVLGEMMMENISEAAIKRGLKKMMTEGKLKVKK
jgi:ABC-type transport system substrate-binding protein